MEQETIIPIKIEGQDAITTLKDLKNAIKANRDALVALGQVEEKDTAKKDKQNKIIEDLQKNTKLLNDVMRASKAQSVESAKGVDVATGSYDELNAELRELRKTFHAMSAAERDSEFGADTIKRINELDVKLKDLDGSVGQYQRNVGNYGKTYKESLDSARESTDQLRTGFEAMNGIAILADEDASALTKTIAGFQVVSNLLEGSKGIGGVVEKGKAWIEQMKTQNVATKMLTKSMTGEAVATGAATTATNIFKKALIATGIGAVVVGIGVLIAHLEDLARVFGFASESAENFEEKNESAMKSLERFNKELSREEEALKAEGKTEEQILRQRIERLREAYEAAEDNTEAEQQLWDQLMDAYTDMTNFQTEQRRLAKEEVVKIAEEQKKKELEQIDAIEQRIDEASRSEIEKLTHKYEEEKALMEKYHKDTTALTEQYNADMARLHQEMVDSDFALGEISKENNLATLVNGGQQEVGIVRRTEEQKTEERKTGIDNWEDITMSGIDAVSSLLSSLADIYESQGEDDKKAQKKAKQLRIAESTINMLMGATTAFSSAFELGPIAGPIVGGVNAAAVIATGLANIAKIKATPVDGSGSASVTPAGTTAVTPPQINTNVPVARQLTSASEEERLNRMAKDQKVYILSSDLQADADARKAVVSETSF